MSIDGHPIKITKNLEHALRNLYRKRIYRLWVDAVCIDQENTEEQGSQVGTMHSIYTKSQRVLVWLGPWSEVVI